MCAKWRKVIVLGAAILAFGVFLNACSKNDSKPKKVVQQITVITPPPPPPPPPPEEIKEPEVEEEVVEEEIDEAPPEDSAEPVSEDLGVDAEGTAGGDSFGLLGKKGGTGLLAGGKYSSYMKAELQKALMKEKKLRNKEYKAIVKLWFGENGEVKRTEVELVSGHDKAKKLLEKFLESFPSLIKSKPLEAEENYYELQVSSLF